MDRKRRNASSEGPKRAEQAVRRRDSAEGRGPAVRRRSRDKPGQAIVGSSSPLRRRSGWRRLTRSRGRTAGLSRPAQDDRRTIPSWRVQLTLPVPPGERGHPVISMSVGPLDRTAPRRSLTRDGTARPQERRSPRRPDHPGIVPNRAEGVRWASAASATPHLHPAPRAHGKIDELKAQLWEISPDPPRAQPGWLTTLGCAHPSRGRFLAHQVSLGRVPGTLVPGQGHVLSRLMLGRAQCAPALRDADPAA